MSHPNDMEPELSTGCLTIIASITLFITTMLAGGLAYFIYVECIKGVLT